VQPDLGRRFACIDPPPLSVPFLSPMVARLLRPLTFFPDPSTFTAFLFFPLPLGEFCYLSKLVQLVVTPPPPPDQGVDPSPTEHALLTFLPARRDTQCSPPLSSPVLCRIFSHFVASAACCLTIFPPPASAETFLPRSQVSHCYAKTRGYTTSFCPAEAPVPVPFFSNAPPADQSAPFLLPGMFCRFRTPPLLQ